MMVSLQKIQPINDKTLEEIGFGWHTDSDESKYVADELVLVTNPEAEAYYDYDDNAWLSLTNDKGKIDGFKKHRFIKINPKFENYGLSETDNRLVLTAQQG